MTDQEYKELLVWCRSKMNHGTEEFKIKYFRKQRAIQIKRMIVLEKNNIKKYFHLMLDCTKDEEKRARMLNIVEESKERKRELLKEFADL